MRVKEKGLKLSRQRWAKKGLQQMTQLRVTYKSGKWNKIKELCKMLHKRKFVMHPVLFAKQRTR